MRKALKIIPIMCLLACTLIFVNRDILHFEYQFPFFRTFSPEEDKKGNYIVTDAIPLKKGIYRLQFVSDSQKNGSGCFILDSSDEIIFAADIRPGKAEEIFPVDITKNTAIRVGFSYSPESGNLEAGNIQIICDNVLYKESALRHGVITVFVLIVFSYIGLRILKPDLPELIREKTGLDYARYEKTFLYLVILTILTSFPLFDPSKFPKGDDFNFHISRIEGIALTLKAGYFPPRILLGWMENYGVGSEFFYPNLFFFTAVIFRLLGFSVISATKIFYFICTFFSLLTMYLAGKNIGKGKSLCGAGAALLYAFASYRLICIYYRNAAGEIQAFIFYPLIVWGLYELLRGNTQKWGIFAFGFFGMAMSHMISLAIAGILCAVYLLISIRRLINDRSIITALLKSALITILAGAFFLFPMIEQTFRTNLLINSYIEGNYLTYESIAETNIAKFRMLFLPFDPWRTDSKIWIGPHPGWIMLLVPLLRIFSAHSRDNDTDFKAADRFTVISLILMVMSTDLFPWRYFEYFLSRIQYSWRLLSPAIVLMSLAGGIYLNSILSSASNKKLLIVFITAAVIISGSPILIYTQKYRLEAVSELSLVGKVITPEEYKPVTLSRNFVINNRDHVVYDPAAALITDFKRDRIGYQFSYERISTENAADYSVPLIYYYGYTADLSDENGNSHKIPVSRDDIGLVRVNDGNLPKGTIHIHYEKTAVQKAGEAISLLTLLMLLLTPVFRKRRKNPDKAAV